MVRTEPKVEPNARYSISDTAKLLGVHRLTVMRWRKMGLIKLSFHPAWKHGFITGTEILSFWRHGNVKF